MQGLPKLQTLQGQERRPHGTGPWTTGAARAGAESASRGCNHGMRFAPAPPYQPEQAIAFLSDNGSKHRAGCSNQPAPRPSCLVKRAQGQTYSCPGSIASRADRGDAMPSKNSQTPGNYYTRQPSRDSTFTKPLAQAGSATDANPTGREQRSSSVVRRQSPNLTLPKRNWPT